MQASRLIILIILFTTCHICVVHPAAAKKKKAPVGYKQTPVKDSALYDGIRYKNILFGSRKLKISAHILEIDLNKKNIDIAVMKAKNHNSELDKLQDIARLHDSTTAGRVLGAINANFWRAYRNNPIGACIIDGEVVEMNPYKEWSGLFFDIKGKPVIDNFKIGGSVRLPDGKIILLSSVNRRNDSMGIVFYNRFGGNIIPHLNSNSINKLINKAYEDVKLDTTYIANDSTESEFDYAEFEKGVIEKARNEMIETSILKAKLRYVDQPSVNKPFRAVIIAVDTGAVEIKNNEALLSLGFNLPPDFILQKGDTIIVNFQTNVHSESVFTDAVTGTPRLVRSGKPGHEAYLEGSRGRRFINGQLARSAIGYSRDKNTVYLVTIDHTSRRDLKKGSSLNELANIMRSIGCYDAMNLDGGGSSIMIIDFKNIMAKSNPEASRKISVAIGVKINCGS